MNDYSLKEVLDIQLRSLTDSVSKLDRGIVRDLEEVKALIRDQNIQIEKRARINEARFEKLEQEIASLSREMRSDVQALKMDNARYKVILGVGATIGASIITYVVNLLFGR